MNGSVLIAAPDINDNNIIQPKNPVLIADLANLKLTLTASAPMQQPVMMFIYLSKLMSAGCNVCRQYAGMTYSYFNKDLTVNLYNLWYDWYRQRWESNKKIFGKIIIAGQNNGFISAPQYVSALLQ
jgi:hypothetical protein